MQEKARVAVLAGGGSPEHGVSLISGQGVYEALCALGYDARLVTVESLDDLVPALRGIDAVFSVLHGGAGEDGTVQRLLEVMEIPYVGSDAQASARAMDKEVAKEQFRLLNIPTPVGVAFREGNPAVFLEAARKAASYPLVVKPISTGSTLGISIARNDEDLSSAVRSCIRDYGDVLVESFVEGRELTVGILDDEQGVDILPIIEIRCPDGFFDFEAKYTDGVSEFLVPAPLAPDVAERVRRVCLEAHRALGCRGYSRVDVRLAEDGTPYILEVNTLPGMTPMSDLPRAAAAAGIPYTQLVERMLSSALRPKEATS